MEVAGALDAGFSLPYNGAFQIGKLRSELEMVSGNVRVMSEMLTELVPTQVEPADLELLQVSKQTPQGSAPPGDPVLMWLRYLHCSLLFSLGTLRQ